MAEIEIKVGRIVADKDQGGLYLLADAIIGTLPGVTRVRFLDHDHAPTHIPPDSLYLEVRGWHEELQKEYGVARPLYAQQIDGVLFGDPSPTVAFLKRQFDTLGDGGWRDASTREGVRVVQMLDPADPEHGRRWFMYFVDWAKVDADYLADIPVGARLKKLPPWLEDGAFYDKANEVKCEYLSPMALLARGLGALGDIAHDKAVAIYRREGLRPGGWYYVHRDPQPRRHSIVWHWRRAQ